MASSSAAPPSSGSPAPTPSALRLRMVGVEKNFGATRALRAVNLEVQPGEVHALVGENGAGKSTLMKVLSGALRPDAGWIELDGSRFIPDNPLHARRHGVAMMYQELNLAPHLSVAENIVLGTEPARCGWVDRATERAWAAAALQELGHASIPLDVPVSSRTLAEQQVVEIARALLGRPRVIIMDEPTSCLSRADANKLFDVITRLATGGVSVVYISHFLEECRRICHRFTVLRDGCSVASGLMADTSDECIIRFVAGRAVSEIYPRARHAVGEPMLELRAVSGVTKPRGVNLTVRAGEIVGVAGLLGAGRTEMVRACFGLDKLAAGVVAVAGADAADRTPAASLNEGVGLLSEDRKNEGLMLNRSVADNLTLSRMKPFTRWGWIGNRTQREVCDRWIKRLNIRLRSCDQAVTELSGGNQQKIALARLLHHEAKVLLLDEPTRGIDIASKAEIYRLMGELAGQGKAIIFISSYLPELLGVCDRIGVMCRGVMGPLEPAGEWTEERIIAAAMGRAANTL